MNGKWGWGKERVSRGIKKKTKKNYKGSRRICRELGLSLVRLHRLVFVLLSSFSRRFGPRVGGIRYRENGNAVGRLAASSDKNFLLPDVAVIVVVVVVLLLLLVHSLVARERRRGRRRRRDEHAPVAAASAHVSCAAVMRRQQEMLVGTRVVPRSAGRPVGRYPRADHTAIQVLEARQRRWDSAVGPQCVGSRRYKSRKSPLNCLYPLTEPLQAPRPYHGGLRRLPAR
ncbi:MAG: hypothetical protein BJ554DRAFT_3478 [Olpidium bornovanus]|uniref:Uncharacterized protein n=1 Tax=Olpidium bornovanus TaxID=278681 RepID=A0A8H7ZNQ0_9FUNG|nr:MAG: hypothetical protein BJ554DRAFT_3478 [Olpidium bornovanus]